MNSKTNNRLQVLVALSGFFLGLITIYGPTWFFLRHKPGLYRSDFLKLHPEKRLTIKVYEIIAFLNILTSPFLSLVLLINTTSWMRPFMLFCYMSNSIGIVNGIFEFITNICPKHGIRFRAYHRETYLYHSGIRGVGLIRIALGVFFIGMCLMIFHI